MEQIITNNIEKFFSYNSLNPIQDWLSLGCSRLVGVEGGAKRRPSLKSVAQILQWWNLAELCLT